MLPDGMTATRSGFGPKETMDRLQEAVTAHGMEVLARIDHAAAAARTGMTLRPTEVILFGNPRAGTPLMQAAQTLGIDLPLKALVWQDVQGDTWVGTNDPAWLAQRHGAATGAERILGAMTDALAKVTKAATSRTTGEAS
jgi:uncharacterized protein (DUF302 family)